MPKINIVDIAVIGAGFSGVMVAANLLNLASGPLSVRLIERNESQFGRGVAYASNTDCHLLNVPAGNMSAYPDQPEHFLNWAKTNRRLLLKQAWVEEIGPETFLSRRSYGEYLNWTLDQAERNADPTVRLQRTFDKAIDLVPKTDGTTMISLSSGESLFARRVVLALGNFPPGNPAIADSGFYRSKRYFRNPWLPGTLQQVLNSHSCLLIGSGLTMVDWAVALDQAGYQGMIHVVSRRGLWPTHHQPVSPAVFKIDDDIANPSVLNWLHQVRQYQHETGSDWRSVIDALRPVTQTLWQRLSLIEQKRFLRYLRPFWDQHRHRLAPSVADKLDGLVKRGKLLRHVGTIVEYQDREDLVEVAVRQRYSRHIRTLEVETVVNCSGTENNYRRLESTLVRNLLQRGLITPDALGLGLRVATNGALIDANGEASQRLFTLGSPKKGVLWETTAVPEVRGQAQQLAKLLLGIETDLSDESVQPSFFQGEMNEKAKIYLGEAQR